MANEEAKRAKIFVPSVNNKNTKTKLINTIVIQRGIHGFCIFSRCDESYDDNIYIDTSKINSLYLDKTSQLSGLYYNVEDPNFTINVKSNNDYVIVGNLNGIKSQNCMYFVRVKNENIQKNNIKKDNDQKIYESEFPDLLNDNYNHQNNNNDNNINDNTISDDSHCENNYENDCDDNFNFPTLSQIYGGKVSAPKNPTLNTMQYNNIIYNTTKNDKIIHNQCNDENNGHNNTNNYDENYPPIKSSVKRPGRWRK